MSLEHDQNFVCPYCGQDNTLMVDTTGGSEQRLVVDCEVCCAPIAVRIKVRNGEIIGIDVRKENE